MNYNDRKTSVKPHNRVSSTNFGFQFAKESLLKIENVFLMFWVIVAMIPSIFTPPGTCPDEEQHIARAEQVAEGQFLPLEVDFKNLDTRIFGVSEEKSTSAIYGGETDSAIYELLTKRYSAIYNDKISELNLSLPYWHDERFQVDKHVGEEKSTWAFGVYPKVCVNSEKLA